MKSEHPSIFRPDAAPLRLTFLVFSGASVMCVASAIDPLRAANRIAGSEFFDWRIVSADGRPPLTSAGLPIAVDDRFHQEENTDVLVVIGGFGTRLEASPAVIATLRRTARAAKAICGVEAGTWLLGHAGLLEGRA